MKRLIFLYLLILISVGCTSNVDRKTQVLDSLKKAYAGKPVNITLTNNPSGTEPITNQYAYIDKDKSDLAFKLESWQKFQLATEEGFIFVPTTDKPEPDNSEMVLIELTNGQGKRGFVHYSFIEEFRELSYYK